MKFIKDIIGEKREQGDLGEAPESGRDDQDMLAAILAARRGVQPEAEIEGTSVVAEAPAEMPLQLSDHQRIAARQDGPDALETFLNAQAFAKAGDESDIDKRQLADSPSEEKTEVDFPDPTAAERPYRIFTRRNKTRLLAEPVAEVDEGLSDDDLSITEDAVDASAVETPELPQRPELHAVFPDPALGRDIPETEFPSLDEMAVDLSADALAMVPVERVKTRLLGFDTDELGEDPFAAEEGDGPTSISQFPVGWLVVVAGPGRGAGFTLFSGVSLIGRGEDQTVSLDFGDTSISRSQHAAIAYDPEQMQFFIGHGGKANLVRRNNRPVLTTEALEAGDVIRIGETSLRFVPLCGKDFTWGQAMGSEAVDFA